MQPSSETTAARSSLRAYSSRRDFLSRSCNGLGALALANLVAEEAFCGPHDPLAERPAHEKRKAKHCIFLFMQGGVSQIDSFDYKPLLNRLHGKPLNRTPNLTGELQGRLTFPHACVGSPFRFARHGQSGHYFSELYPQMSRHADRMAFIHGIKTDNQNHGPSTLHVTTGSQFPGSPSIGSWMTYGLGTENQNMPAYVAIQDPRGAPMNGAAVWANGYLPATYQGTMLRPNGTPILNLARPSGLTHRQQRRELDALEFLNRRHLARRSNVSELEARISSYELAFRMQARAPGVVDLTREPEHIHRLYGLDNPATANFGRQCLLARRMVEQDRKSV
ncbi:MAG: DUF1501 domain-containing protein, partial [Planctomycetaceae bacterium]